MRPAPLVTGLALACTLGSCGRPPTTVQSTLPAAPAPVRLPDRSAPPGGFSLDDTLQGLRMHLRSVAGVTEPDVAAAPTPAKVLGDKRTRALLSRLPALTAKAATEPFRKRPGSRPPPRSGDTVEMALAPPKALPPAVDDGPLRVLRHGPEGKVPLAPHASITFSAPMVAVTSHAELAATDAPATIDPMPPGRFRWLGSRTLLFDPEPRFPMATRYAVTVAATARAADGRKLGKAHRFDFETGRLRLLEHVPTQHETADLSPVIALRFDQRVDHAALLPFVRLNAAGRRVELRTATDAELEADEAARTLLAEAPQDRTLALAPVTPLPPGSKVSLTIAKGAPSAEGPLTSHKDQLVRFETRAALTLEHAGCQRKQARCTLGEPLQLRFNNILGRLPDELVQVEPAIGELQVWGVGRTLFVRGDEMTVGRHRVTVPASLLDRFGQTLGAPVVADIEVVPRKRRPPYPRVYGPHEPIVTLPPGTTSMRVISAAHRKLTLTVQQVEAADFAAYRALQRGHRRRKQTARLPGKRVYRGSLEIEDPTRASALEIDLAPYLKDGRGHLLVKLHGKTRYRDHDVESTLVHWVQATDLGLVALSDREQLLAWVTSLATGKPAAGATVGLVAGGGVKPVDDSGLARLELTEADRPLLVARLGHDWALLPRTPYPSENGWRRRLDGPELQVFTFDDRSLYKPGETAHVKGIVRSFEQRGGGDLTAARGVGPLRWELVGPSGNALAQGKTRLDDHGGFALDLTLPTEMNLGSAQLRIRGKGIEHYASIAVQEFRRPRFEISATAKKPEAILGDEAVVTTRANYFAGGGLPQSPVQYVVTATSGRFRPADWPRYSFGPWRPWWWRYHRPDDETTSRKTSSGTTDSHGEHRLGIHFEAMNPPQLTNVAVEAVVTDVDRQTMSATAQVVVHPSRTYVGLATEHGFTAAGQPLRVQTVVVDPEGAAVAEVPARLVLSRVRHRTVRGQWQEELEEVANCEVLSAADPEVCEFAPSHGGAYVIDATVRDAEGRPNATQLRVWVSGPTGEQPPRVSALELEQVELVPDRRRYQPGETARVLVASPFYPAEGVLTVERMGILSHRAITLTGPTAFEVPVESAHVPGFDVGVELVGALPRPGASAQVLHAAGSVRLEVPPLERTLAVEVAPARDTLEPGAATKVALTVKDAEGKPLRDASIAVLAVDEAVLALSDYRPPDPLSFFYRTRHGGVERRRMRSGVQVARAPGDPVPADAVEEAMEFEEVIPMSAGRAIKTAGGSALRSRSARMAGALAQVTSVRVRSDFSAAALFAPDVRTDRHGRATVELKLPDSLTRYRVTAVAIDRDRRFGVAEASVRAALPLRVQPSPPRFSNFGDRFELPVVLHNATDEAAEVDLAVRVDNFEVASALDRLGDKRPMETLGLAVTVPPRDRVEVRVPTATRRPGQARVQVVAVSSGGHADAADLRLPVYTPATDEAFATYGELTDRAHRLEVATPRDVFREFGGLSVTTSSTQLQALTDALLYVVDYPYECSEQLASRILSVLSLHDVLRAFEAPELPPGDALSAMIDRDIEQLRSRQFRNGGFGFWSRHAPREDPYVSVHVAAALALAKAKGRPVPARMLKKVEGYLARLETHVPKHFGERARHALLAYGLDVRRRLGKRDAAEATKLWKQHRGQLSVEALGWLLPTLAEGGKRDTVADVLRALGNRAHETAGSAHFTTAYDDGEYTILHSRRRADAIVLDALLQVRPDDDLIAKLARGLLSHRVRGRWLSTQENTFVLQALRRYFGAREGVTPDFVARVWLGDGLRGEHRFAGRTTERANLQVPMRRLARPGRALPLTLAREGAGRLYYRVGLRYAPRDLDLPASDHGFVLSRTYRAVDAPDDVRRLDDGGWWIRAGARVEVELEMVADARRDHVALVDPLPAGLEAINPALRTSPSPPEPEPLDRGRVTPRPQRWPRTWYEHQNLRDERVEAFTTRLRAGVHSYRYYARATTPGRFVVPPPKAEEMYDPETFGRGESDRVTIE